MFLSYWDVILDVEKICKANWVKATCLGSPKSAKVSLCISSISVENSFHRKWCSMSLSPFNSSDNRVFAKWCESPVFIELSHPFYLSYISLLSGSSLAKQLLGAVFNSQHTAVPSEPTGPQHMALTQMCSISTSTELGWDRSKRVPFDLPMWNRWRLHGLTCELQALLAWVCKLGLVCSPCFSGSFNGRGCWCCLLVNLKSSHVSSESWSEMCPSVLLLVRYVAKAGWITTQFLF